MLQSDEDFLNLILEREEWMFMEKGDYTPLWKESIKDSSKMDRWRDRWNNRFKEVMEDSLEEEEDNVFRLFINKHQRKID